MLGCLSCAIFFIEPNPFEDDKIDFLIILTGIVWVIYTIDHMADGYTKRGHTGILRYDFNYRHRAVLIPMCMLVSLVAVWLIFKNKDSMFVSNGIWLVPVIPLYFFFKLRGKFSPIAKMFVISVIFSTVVVSLYQSYQLLIDFLTFERLIVLMMAMLNQVVLEHFEFHEDKSSQQPDSDHQFSGMGKRIFLWIMLMLVFTTVLNPHSWPVSISIFLVSLFMRLILTYQHWFKANRRYRFWADFSLILLWPLFRFFTGVKGVF